MPPHSSQPRQHLVNGQSRPVRGHSSRRRAPHWADCVCRDPVQAALAPGGPPRPGRFLDGTLFSSVSSPAQEDQLLLQDVHSTLLRFSSDPGPAPRLTGKPYTSPEQSGPLASRKPWKQLPSGCGWDGGSNPQMHLLSDPQGGAVFFTDGEAEAEAGTWLMTVV